jgi:hypothetical protein
MLKERQGRARPVEGARKGAHDFTEASKQLQAEQHAFSYLGEALGLSLFVFVLHLWLQWGVL